METHCSNAVAGSHGDTLQLKAVAGSQRVERSALCGFGTKEVLLYIVQKKFFCTLGCLSCKDKCRLFPAAKNSNAKNKANVNVVPPVGAFGIGHLKSSKIDPG